MKRIINVEIMKALLILTRFCQIDNFSTYVWSTVPFTTVAFTGQPLVVRAELLPHPEG